MNNCKIFNKNCFTVLYEIYLEAIWAHFLSEANPLKKVRSERTGRKQGWQHTWQDFIKKYKVRSNIIHKSLDEKSFKLIYKTKLLHCL